MATASDWLRSLGLDVVRPENALVCTNCRVALRVEARHVINHYVHKHQHINVQCERLKSELSTTTLVDAPQLKPRPDFSPHHALLIVSSGFACTACPSRTTSSQVARQASNCIDGRAHNYETALLQCWVQGGPHSRQYWIVKTPSTKNGMVTQRPMANPRSRKARPHIPHDRASVTTESRLLTRVYEEETQRLHQKAYVVDESNSPLEDDLSLRDPWVERTGWANVYRDAPRSLLFCMSQTPDKRSCSEGMFLGTFAGQDLRTSAEEERRLQYIMNTVHAMFERAQQTVQHTSRHLLCWLRSYRPNQPYRKPFQLVGRDSSLSKYVRVWKRSLSVLVRLIVLQSRGTLLSLKIPLHRPMRDRVIALWNASLSGGFGLDDCLVQMDNTEFSDDEYEGESDLEDEDDEEEEEDSGDEDDQSQEDTWHDGEILDDEQDDEGFHPHSPRDRSTDWEGQLLESVFHLSTALCMEEFTDGQPHSTTLIYLGGILGFTDDGAGFQRPARYTPTISALIYLQRLLFLEYALPYQPYQHRGRSGPAQSEYLCTLRQVQARYMCEGSATPLGELTSLLPYGREMLKTEQPSIFFRWSDDDQTVHFAEHSLHLDHYRQFAWSLLDTATDRCNELMFHWAPAISLEQARDVISNREPGYSFVQDPRNQMKGLYLQLFHRACAAGPDSLIQGDQWHLWSVSRYLGLHESYLADLMLVMEIWCGLTARGSELFSIEVCNGPINPRGIYLYNGQVMYVAPHHKARRSTDHAFHVARYFPPFAGHLIVKYLVFIRPLVYMVLRKCMKTSTASNLLFVSQPTQAGQSLFRQWRTTDLSSHSRRRSLGLLQIPLGIRLLRQLTIAIVNKHLRSFSRPSYQYDDRSVNADSDVVWDWLSGHRPAQSGRSYGLDGAFPHLLQPRLLHQYGLKSSQWHRFLCLSARKQPLVSSNLNHNGEMSVPLSKRQCIQPSTTRPALQELDVNQVGHAQTSISFHLGTGNTKALRKASVQQSLPVALTSPLPSYEHMDLVTIIARFHIVVCQRCQVGVLLDRQWDTHFGRLHQLSLAARNALKARVLKQDSQLIQTQDNLVERFQYPAGQIPLPQIPVFEKGYACNETLLNGERCLYACLAKTSMKIHCEEKHSWQNPQPPGGSAARRRDIVRPWRENVLLQRLFLYGPLNGYWEVSPDKIVQQL